MKAKLLIQKQTRSVNYKRYGGVDNRVPSDKGKAPLVVSNTAETANISAGKRKGVAME